MEELDARLRLTNLLSVCENEIQALDDLRDPRLKGVLQAMATLRAEMCGYRRAHECGWRRESG
jgi:hypothetical protein